MTLTQGQRVSFTCYGKPETAMIERIANGIVWLDNGRWVHAESVTPIPPIPAPTKQHATKAGRSKAARAHRELQNYLDQEIEKEIKATGSGRPDTMARVINPPDNGL
jgi:hypothetical protein